MKSYVIVTLLVCSQSLTSFGLSPADIMFIAYNADGTDGFSILALVDIPANSTVYFNDNEWNGSAIGSGGAFYSSTEGEITWNSGASILAAGTVVIFENTKNTVTTTVTEGTVTGNIDLNSTDEVLYAFEGTDDVTPTTFLSAIANDGFSDVSEGTGGNGTLENTGLTVAVNAIEFSDDDDVIIYMGSTTCNNTVADCAAVIADPVNWDGEGGAGDQSSDSNAPEFPSGVAPSFSGSALPIKLSDFSAVYVDETISIHWETASEINNDYFVLKRSMDGEIFETVSKISGKGTTNESHQYSFNDIVSGNNVNGYYYQLTQFDFDGKSEVFPMVYVRFESILEVNIYPNPVINGNIEVNASDEIISIYLLDGMGKIVQEYVSDMASFEANLDVESVLSGSYLLKIETKRESITKRVIIR